MKHITFECYGQLQQLIGQSVLSLPCTFPLDLQQALQQLANTYPQLEHPLQACACAIGDELVPRHHLLHQHTCVALLPPVAGG